MLNFPAVRLAVTDDAYILSAETSLTTLSSAVVGGGFQQSRTIVNRHVPLTYDCSDPVGDLQRFASALNITDPFVGMLTGVPMNGTRVV
ncbi:MAG: adenosylcobinamide amidohydrolase, partial [Ktedonobacteraceae bacterium]|nr:adenosylcobinamide amidohydrolase [Ktedonobacteraceae bacterium]